VAKLSTKYPFFIPIPSLATGEQKLDTQTKSNADFESFDNQDAGEEVEDDKLEQHSSILFSIRRQREMERENAYKVVQYKRAIELAVEEKLITAAEASRLRHQYLGEPLDEFAAEEMTYDEPVLQVEV
jgi:hypothetical protein